MLDFQKWYIIMNVNQKSHIRSTRYYYNEISTLDTRLIHEVSYMQNTNLQKIIGQVVFATWDFHCFFVFKSVDKVKVVFCMLDFHCWFYMVQYRFCLGPDSKTGRDARHYSQECKWCLCYILFSLCLSYGG